MWNRLQRQLFRTTSHRTVDLKFARDPPSVTRPQHDTLPRAAHACAPLTALDRTPSQPGNEDWEQTIRQAIAGHSSAVRRVLIRVVPQIRALCHGVLGREHPEIEDAVQESLLALIRALPGFRFEADISHFAVRIALRRAIRVRERHRKNRARFPFFPASGAPEEGTQAERRASVRRALLRELLTELPRPQAEAIILRVLLEYSTAEVGAITGVSPNTVKTRLTLAKRTLKRKIAGNPGYRAAFEEALDD